LRIPRRSFCASFIRTRRLFLPLARQRLIGGSRTHCRTHAAPHASRMDHLAHRASPRTRMVLFYSFHARITLASDRLHFLRRLPLHSLSHYTRMGSLCIPRTHRHYLTSHRATPHPATLPSHLPPTHLCTPGYASTHLFHLLSTRTRHAHCTPHCWFARTRLTLAHSLTARLRFHSGFPLAAQIAHSRMRSENGGISILHRVCALARISTHIIARARASASFCGSDSYSRTAPRGAAARIIGCAAHHRGFALIARARASRIIIAPRAYGAASYLQHALPPLLPLPYARRLVRAYRRCYTYRSAGRKERSEGGCARCLLPLPRLHARTLRITLSRAPHAPRLRMPLAPRRHHRIVHLGNARGSRIALRRHQ